MRWLLCASIACALAYGAIAQSNGWDFTPLNGATNRQDAQLLALSASFINETDPRLPAWFASFKQTFYKTYPNAAAENRAYQNFLNNLNKIYSVNQDLNIQYWLTGNAYADMSYEEFKRKILTNLTVPQSTNRGRMLMNEPPSEEELAARRKLQGTSIDWRQAGRESPMKDQGQCGSCWAFAATAAIEGQYNIYMNQRSSQTGGPVMSEQQILDCSGAGSCNGGGSPGAINYCYDNFLVKDSFYPYTGYDGNCYAPSNPPNGGAIQLNQKVQYVDTYSESALMQAVSKGPVVIYFEVDNDFFSYSGGVYQPSGCGSAVNHAMVAVGYYYTGDSSSSYWIIRNSWGSGWGQNGYCFIQMTGDGAGPCGLYTNTFGIANDFYLTLAPPSPTESPPPPVASPPPPDYPYAPDPPTPPPPTRSPPPPRPRRFRRRPPRPPPRRRDE